MAVPNYYDVLGLSSSSTQDEIRRAYLFLMRQVRAGELPAGIRPLVEQAYADLGQPDRRLRYDFALTDSPEADERRLPPSAPPMRTAPANRARPAAHPHGLHPRLGVLRAGMLTAVLVTLIGISTLALAKHRSGSRTPPVPAQAAVSRVGTLGGAAPPRRAAQPPQIPASPSEPEASAESPAGPPQPSEPVSQPARSPLLLPEPAAVRSPQRVSRWYEPPAVVARPAGVEAAETPAADAAPQADALASAPPEAASSPPETGAVTSACAAPDEPALVWSHVFSGSRTTFRVPGRYCLDASGGTVFVPMTAPVPVGLTC